MVVNLFVGGIVLAKNNAFLTESGVVSCQATSLSSAETQKRPDKQHKKKITTGRLAVRAVFSIWGTFLFHAVKVKSLWCSICSGASLTLFAHTTDCIQFSSMKSFKQVCNKCSLFFLVHFLSNKENDTIVRALSPSVSPSVRPSVRLFFRNYFFSLSFFNAAFCF